MHRGADPPLWQPFQGKAGHSATNSSAPALPARKVTHSCSAHKDLTTPVPGLSPGYAGFAEDPLCPSLTPAGQMLADHPEPERR